MPKLSEPSPRSEAAIWERVIHPTGVMSRVEARQIIALKFSAEERRRMRDLAERNRSGTLAPGEEEELDNICRVGNTLSLLMSRARTGAENSNARCVMLDRKFAAAELGHRGIQP